MKIKSELPCISLIPQPVELNLTGGTFVLTADAVIAYADGLAQPVAELLAVQLRQATGFALPVTEGTDAAIVFQKREDSTLGTEGYELKVLSNVVISAPEVAGLFCGAQTLRQLFPVEIYTPSVVSTVWSLPRVEIRDFPRFGWRGLHLDVCRHFMPKADVLKFIDTMASFKFNILHWHLTEDQGWRIEIKKYPKLTEVGAWRKETLIGYFEHFIEEPDNFPYTFDGIPHGGFYTQDEIREVVAYATERNITIVPEIDMPGHMVAAITAYPELGCTGNPTEVRTTWGISEDILNPEESTVQFCKDVLAEVIELFPSEFIHVGGDEAPKKQWEESERIQQLREERGLKDMDEMQSWFIRQMDGFLTANGRRLIGWDEIAEGGLAANAAVMWWRGNVQQNEGMDIAIHAAQAGHDIVVAPSGKLYFDQYQSESKKDEPLCIGGFISLDAVYSFDPIMEGLDEATAAHILGPQGQLWTEYIPNLNHLEFMAYPRACALAEIAWLPESQKDYTRFLDYMKVQQLRFDASGVNYRALV